jgi:UDP-GlcNAc:undecaprenyl-phosphate GlcNAc-1-phosphate transferase
MGISILLFTLSLSVFFIIILQKIFIKYDLVDEINKRSSHNVIATRSGGIGLLLTIFIISLYHYFLGDTIYDFSIIIPVGLIAVVGLYDDIYKVDFKLKFIFQIIAAKMIIDNGLIIDNLHGVFGVFEFNRLLAHLLTMFIILSIINSINFIDGIDGLAITITTMFIVCFESFSVNPSPFLSLSLILLFSILPLFYFNFKDNNKIFLGDSGSHFIGGIVSVYVIYILSNNYIIKPEFDIHKVIFVFSILSYPIIDLIRVFIFRVLRKKSPFIADRNHIHHYLIDKYKNHKLVVTIILFASIIIMIFSQLVFRSF